MFQKTSGFVKKPVVSDFWGISSILRLLYRFFLFKKKKKHTDLDPNVHMELYNKPPGIKYANSRKK